MTDYAARAAAQRAGVLAAIAERRALIRGTAGNQAAQTPDQEETTMTDYTPCTACRGTGLVLLDADARRERAYERDQKITDLLERRRQIRNMARAALASRSGGPGLPERRRT
jgi:hypothetical protein